MELQNEVNVQKEKPSLFGMFTNPVQQFERIRENPKILVPLVIVSILYAIGTVFMAFSIDASTLIDQGLPEDQVEIVLTITKITVAITDHFAYFGCVD